MKQSRMLVVVSVLLLLILVSFWAPPSFKNQGVVLNMKQVVRSTLVAEVVVHMNQLTLIEFFAGY